MRFTERQGRGSTSRETSRNGSSSSTSSTISTYAMKQIVEDLKFNRFRYSTRKNYYTVWRSFNEFFVKLDDKPKDWESRLILFIGYLVQEGKKAQTIKSYISGIKAVLKDINVELNEDRFLISSLTNACKLLNNKVRLRLPIQKRLLSLILQEITNLFHQQPYLNVMYLALFSTMYFGLFRIGEMTSGSHPVKARDVHIAHNKKKMLFVLRTSKTHWNDTAPQTVTISSNATRIFSNKLSDGLDFCPFQLLKDYTSIRESYLSNDEPFFVFRNRDPVTPLNARTLLRQLLHRLHLNENNYDTHSLRIGRCVDLLKMQISVETIKKLGRWKSNVVFDYLRKYC